jgi:spore maturation protein CgeB
MNILFLDWACFGRRDVLEFFSKRQDNVTLFAHPDYDLRVSKSFTEEANKLLSEKDFDFCFSYNYFPLMATVCHEHNLKYIAFVYDNPQVKLYSYTVTYSTNFIFLFDSSIVEQFRKEGISTFYYMPLPVNPNKIHSLLQQPYDRERLSAEVSFVGSLYNEAHNLYDSLEDLPSYTKGFLEGILSAQSKVYGMNFMEECLTPSVMEELSRVVPYQKNVDGVENPSYIFSDYFLCRKLTSRERIAYLTAVAEQFPLKLFTQSEDAVIGNAHNMGLADYITEMPYIFHDSKINLNISLRSIKNGIPLRCMDIMASGGFLLTNFQNDFLKHFVPDQDFVYYESKEDLLRKIDYYLNHDAERMEIARSGYEKVQKNHNYDIIFDQIYEIVFNKSGR